MDIPKKVDKHCKNIFLKTAVNQKSRF